MIKEIVSYFPSPDCTIARTISIEILTMELVIQCKDMDLYTFMEKDKNR